MISLNKRCRHCGSTVYFVAQHSQFPTREVVGTAEQRKPDPVSYECGYCSSLFSDPEKFFIVDAAFEAKMGLVRKGGQELTANALAPRYHISQKDVDDHLSCRIKGCRCLSPESCPLLPALAQERCEQITLLLTNRRGYFQEGSSISKLEDWLKQLEEQAREYEATTGQREKEIYELVGQMLHSGQFLR